MNNIQRVSIVPALLAAVALVALGAAATQSKPAESPVSIPADAEKAVEKLTQSPRHGEWADVTVPGSETKIHSWIVYPERAGKAPVVLVIHEIFGMSDWVRAVADQLAADGFIAIAPDLLSGKGPGGGNTDSFAGDQVRNAISKLDRDEVVRNLNAVREFALTLPSAAAKSAAIGFCWGGSTVFKYATQQPKLDAGVVYYGTAPSDKDNKPDAAQLGKIACPILGCYGGDDARVTSTVEPTATAMKELKKSFTPHVHEGAGHGFLRQQSGRDGANLAAAQQAWAETIAFLKKNLE